VTRRRGWMLFVLGLILALSAGALVFVVLQQQAAIAAEQSRAAALREFAPPPTLKLPVAARPLEAGMTLGSADYVMKDFPLDLVPVSAITDTASLDNKLLVRAVGQGETFATSQFLGGQGATVSQQIQQGRVLFAFPIVDLLSKSDLIQDGDHVDLLLTLPLVPSEGAPADTQGKTTAITLQNIEIFKVLRVVNEDEKQKGEATSLLCSLTPEDAVMIKFIKDSGGTIDFTLRSPADKEPFQAPPVNRAELANRYGLK
jgi:pilus assembly protein CpaB